MVLWLTIPVPTPDARLYLLLRLYGGVKVAEYSSHISHEQRKQILNDFRNDKIHMYVYPCRRSS